MNWIKSLDATIIVAFLALLGTVYSVWNSKNEKKKDSMIQANEQLMNMVNSLSEQMISLKEQHSNESKKLQKQIVELTTENQELRNEVNKLNNLLIKLGIPV